jgi:phosphate transport system substrate-binding protein
VLVGLTLTIPRAQAARSVTVTPNDQLTHGQYVRIAWSDFGSEQAVLVQQCPKGAASFDTCAKSSTSQREPGDPKAGISGTDGRGSIPFVIRAGDVAPVDGSDPFFCDWDSACQIVVAPIPDDGSSPTLADAVSVDLAFALSTVPCPLGGDRIAGSGGSSARAAMTQWQSEVCRDDLTMNVSYVTSNSLQGVDAFVNRFPDSDFALTGVPLTEEEHTKLAQTEIHPRHVPVAAGSLAFVYNLWDDRNGDGRKEQVDDLQLSPATLAAIMQGRINTWNDPAVKADNPGVTMPPKQVKPVGRADNSAATYWMTKWFYDTAREAWEAGGTSFQDGPTAIFPAGNGVLLRTGTDAVAEHVRKFPGEQTDENADVPFPGLIGYVYYSEALKLGLPVVALRNASGNYVKPDSENVTAAFNAGTVSDDAVFTPDFAASDPKAYPLPVASYVVAATGDDKDIDPDVAKTLGRFLMYTNGPGQQAATSRGFVPLTEPLRLAAEANISKVAQQPAAALTPSPAAAAAAPTASPVVAPVVAPVFAPAVGGETAGSPPTSEEAGDAPVPSASSGGPIPAPPMTAAVPPEQPGYSAPTSSAPEPEADAPPAEAAVEAVRDAIVGVLGLGSVGSVPVGLPALGLAALCALFAGRMLLNASRGVGFSPGDELKAFARAPSRLIERVRSNESAA